MSFIINDSKKTKNILSRNHELPNGIFISQNNLSNSAIAGMTLTKIWTVESTEYRKADENLEKARSSLKTWMDFYNSKVFSTLWHLKSNKKKLNAFDIKYPKKILQVKKNDFVTNSEVRRLSNLCVLFSMKFSNDGWNGLTK